MIANGYLKKGQSFPYWTVIHPSLLFLITNLPFPIPVAQTFKSSQHKSLATTGNQSLFVEIKGGYPLICHSHHWFSMESPLRFVLCVCLHPELSCCENQVVQVDRLAYSPYSSGGRSRCYLVTHLSVSLGLWKPMRWPSFILPVLSNVHKI